MRYDKELKQLEKKGFFINKDGKDSRDIYKPPKKSSDEEKNTDHEMSDEGPQKKKSAKAMKEDRKSQELYDENVCKPKKPMTSFMLFSNENRTKVMQENPNISITDIAK